MKAIIISADELKKTIDGYDPNNSHLVHEESTRLADKEYSKALKASDYQQVVLLSGGSASGKTEFLATYLMDKEAIIMDGTLKNPVKAQEKTDQAIKYGKRLKVVAIWPKDLSVAFAAFLSRERKYPDEFFYKTHSESRATLLSILESTGIEVELYENSFKDDSLEFSEYSFESRTKFIEFVRENQYTEEEILKLVGRHD